AYEQMVRFSQGLQARGILKAVESLKSDREAARIEIRNGKRRMVDGPFAESKEIVGGFFLLDVATREEALRIASECPAAEWAAVEGRERGPCHWGGGTGSIWPNEWGPARRGRSEASSRAGPDPVAPSPSRLPRCASASAARLTTSGTCLPAR